MVSEAGSPVHELEGVEGLGNLRQVIPSSHQGSTVEIPHRLQSGSIIRQQDSGEVTSSISNVSPNMEISGEPPVVMSSEGRIPRRYRHLRPFIPSQFFNTQRRRDEIKMQFPGVEIPISTLSGIYIFHVDMLDVVAFFGIPPNTPSLSFGNHSFSNSAGFDPISLVYVASSVSPQTAARRRENVLLFKTRMLVRGLPYFSEIDILNYLLIVSDYAGTRTDLCSTIELASNGVIVLSQNVWFRRHSAGHAFLHPRSPKYDEVWDIHIIWNFLKTNYLSDKPNIRLRTFAVILLRLSIAGRNKDIAHVSRFLRWEDDKVSFRLFHWKGNRRDPRRYSEWFVIRRLPLDQSYRCAYHALRSYVDSFSDSLNSLPSDCQFLWLHWRDSRPVVHETLARDQKMLMVAAGIPSHFGPASLRQATISYWRSMGVPYADVMKRTGHRSQRVVHLFL